MTGRGALLVAVAVLTGCDDFDPAPGWLIAGPRVLAVSADPPAIALDGAVVLDALVVDASGARVDTALAWRVCDPWRFVLDPDVDCAGPAALVVDGGFAAREVLERFPVPEGTALEPGDANDSDVDGCTAPPALDLPVALETVVDGERLVAIKRVPLIVPALPAPATNPTLAAASLEPSMGDAPAGEDAYHVEVAVDPASLDMECRDGERVPEVVRIYAYATGGELEDPTADVVPDADGSVERAQLRWTGGPDEAVWLVAMDRGGGTTWTRVAP